MFQLAAGVIVFHIWLDCVSILIGSVDVFMVSFTLLFCSPHHQLISFIIRFTLDLHSFMGACELYQRPNVHNGVLRYFQSYDEDCGEVTFNGKRKQGSNEQKTVSVKFP